MTKPSIRMCAVSILLWSPPALLLALGMTACVTTHGPPQVDVCRNQAHEFAARKLGARVISVGLTWANTAGTGPAEVWLRTDHCDGEFVIRLNANQVTCQLPHYGHIPDYLGPVLAVTGDCTMP